MKEVHIIVAMGKQNEIGLDNDLLCHIKPDLAYFKRTTKDHIVIMGRKTFFSLPNGPLPHRDNIVITRNKAFSHEGVSVAGSIEETLEIAKSLDPANEKKVFVIGGASIYEQFLPIADKLYVTHIFEEFEADVYFPAIGKEWVLESIDAKRENIEHAHQHMFAVYTKALES